MPLRISLPSTEACRFLMLSICTLLSINRLNSLSAPNSGGVSHQGVPSGIRCEYVHVRSTKSSLILTIPEGPTRRLPRYLFLGRPNYNGFVSSASFVQVPAQCLRQRAGWYFPGPSKTWMFLRSVQGRIHSVSRKVPPGLLATTKASGAIKISPQNPQD